MNLSSRDRACLWHPYTQMKTAPPPIAVVGGEGAELIDDQGRRYIDAIASWWVNLHGHSHPHIAERMAQQARELEHVIFAGFTHEPAVELGEKLLEILPQNQRRVFYSDNGSTAVEVGLKLAIQHSRLVGTNRKRFVALRGGYHGDTFGAMSVSDRSGFTTPFVDHLFDVSFIDPPQAGTVSRAVEDLERELKGEDIVAFVFEPLVQGVAGFKTHPPEGLDQLLRLCRKHDVLTIADEVFTGFGRTGTLFASDQLEAAPDVICLSKGLTGGTMALGVTTTTNEIFEAFLSDDWGRAFFHGHSFTANPIACSVALASLELLLDPACTERRAAIDRAHAEFATKVRGRKGFKEVRHLGNVLAVELDAGGETSYFNEIGPELAQYYLDQGVLLRPLGNVFYTVPPYCITDEQLARVHEMLEIGIDKAAERSG